MGAWPNLADLTVILEMFCPQVIDLQGSKSWNGL